MRKKGLILVLLLVVLLAAESAIALAGARYSNWISTRYTDIFYQEANWSGGTEIEGVRWGNQSSHRVKITMKFVYRQTNEDVGQRVLYLEGGNSYSKCVQIKHPEATHFVRLRLSFVIATWALLFAFFELQDYTQ